MINELKHTVFTEKYSVLYDIDPSFIKEEEKYDTISAEELVSFREYKSNYDLTVSMYKGNVDKLIREYKEIISQNKLKRIIEDFPKKKNGQFQKRTVVLAKSSNTVPDKELKTGCTHGLIVAAYKTRRILEIKYIKGYSVV